MPKMKVLMRRRLKSGWWRLRSNGIKATICHGHGKSWIPCHNYGRPFDIVHCMVCGCAPHRGSNLYGRWLEERKQGLRDFIRRKGAQVAEEWWFLKSLDALPTTPGYHVWHEHPDGEMHGVLGQPWECTSCRETPADAAKMLISLQENLGVRRGL